MLFCFFFILVNGSVFAQNDSLFSKSISFSTSLMLSDITFASPVVAVEYEEFFNKNFSYSIYSENSVLDTWKNRYIASHTIAMQLNCNIRLDKKDIVHFRFSIGAGPHYIVGKEQIGLAFVADSKMSFKVSKRCRLEVPPLIAFPPAGRFTFSTVEGQLDFFSFVIFPVQFRIML